MRRRRGGRWGGGGGYSEENFPSIAAVARSFVKEVETKVGRELEHPWSEVVGPAVAASSASVAGPETTPNFVQFDASGKAVGVQRMTLLNSGFVVGASVVDDAGATSRIRNITPDGRVSLSPEADVAFDDFMRRFRSKPKDIELVPDIREVCPSRNDAYLDIVLRSQVAVALASAAQMAPPAMVEVQMKPTRLVRALEKYAAGKLVLVPETQRLSVIGAGAPLPVGSLPVHAPDNKRVALLPQFSPSFVVPAWAVQTTQNPSEANLGVSHRKVSMSVRACKGENTFDLEIPVIVNTKAVKPGDSLVVLRADEPAPIKAAPAKRVLVDRLPAAKKAKA